MHELVNTNKACIMIWKTYRTSQLMMFSCHMHLADSTCTPLILNIPKKELIAATWDDPENHSDWKYWEIMGSIGEVLLHEISYTYWYTLSVSEVTSCNSANVKKKVCLFYRNKLSVCTSLLKIKLNHKCSKIFLVESLMIFWLLDLFCKGL